VCNELNKSGETAQLDNGIEKLNVNYKGEYMAVFLMWILFIILSPILLLIGLIKPKLILRWTKKPTRLKVTGLWFLALLFCILITAISDIVSIGSGMGLKPKQNKTTGKWGYVEAGKEKIPFQYDEAGPFVYYYVSGLQKMRMAKVKSSSKYGFIDETGKEIIPVKYDEIADFSYRYADMVRVKLNNKYGLVDNTGKEVISPIYDEIESFSNIDYGGMTKVKLNDKYGLVDNTGKEVISPVYDEIGRFSNTDYGGMTKVKLNNQYGLVDKTGKEVISPVYDEIGRFSYEYANSAKVKLNNQYGLVDNTGKEVIPTRYDEIINYSDGLAEVKLDGQKYYVDKAGMKYSGREKYIIEKLLVSQIRQINNYRLKLNKNSKDSIVFRIHKPYLVIDAATANGNDMYICRYSGSNLSVSGLKTLIIKYDYLDSSEPYIEERTQRRVTIRSYGAFLIYYDITMEKIIGYDKLYGTWLPMETTQSNDRFISITDISEKIDSRLATGSE